jgi:signal transduction histidine kinase
MIESERRRTEPGHSEPREAWLSAGAGTRWWSLEDVRARLSPEIHVAAERVLACMFLPDDAAEEAFEGLPSGLSLESIQSIIGAFRDAITEASDRGAPPRAVRGWHERLDREGFRLGQTLVERGIADSRGLLQDVSHDLRSPLNSVLFLADTLLSGHSGPLNPIQQRQVGVLYTAAVTLVGLVNDLIDAARLGSATDVEISHAAFSVERVLSDVESLLSPLATHRHIDLAFQLETLGPRYGDPQMLSRVLINLLSNAIQAVDEGGRVEVKVGEPESGWLQALVHDDGPGDNTAELRALLADTNRDAYQGRRGAGWTHGLGLKICSRLVEAAGGTIGVEGEPGRGTVLTVDLPFPRV